MFSENRLIYLEGHKNQPPESSEVSPEMIAEAKEFTKGAAEVAVAVETGNWEDAAMKFYEAFLKTPEKMKRYRDYMMISTNPLLWLSQYVPLVGILAKIQIAFTEKAIDKLFSVMGKFRDLTENSPTLQALAKAHGEWEKLDKVDQDAIKEVLAGCIK